MPQVGHCQDATGDGDVQGGRQPEPVVLGVEGGVRVGGLLRGVDEGEDLSGVDLVPVSQPAQRLAVAAGSSCNGRGYAARSRAAATVRSNWLFMRVSGGRACASNLGERGMGGR
jgi:hypothetical protein